MPWESNCTQLRISKTFQFLLNKFRKRNFCVVCPQGQPTNRKHSFKASFSHSQSHSIKTVAVSHSHKEHSSVNPNNKQVQIELGAHFCQAHIDQDRARQPYTNKFFWVNLNPQSSLETLIIRKNEFKYYFVPFALQVRLSVSANRYHKIATAFADFVLKVL